MTSGQFHSIRIDQIIIDRDHRQRRTLTKIDELAGSMRQYGLIHPIVVTRDNRLVAGERRTEAARILGWTHITCQYTDEIDPRVLRCLELEENIKRTDLTWQEVCLATAEWHDLSCAIAKESGLEWSQKDTAEKFSLGEATVSEHVKIATHVHGGRTDLLEAPQQSAALTKLSREESRQAIASYLKLLNLPKERSPVVCANFTEWVETYDGPLFNFVHCDFPYGIGADKRHQGDSVFVHGGYDDSEDTYWSLVRSLCDNIPRICTESCHFMFWFSMRFYQPTLDYFTDNTDVSLDPFPLIWMKTDNIGLLPDPQRGPRRIYETCLFGSRGDRKIVSSVSNAYGAPTDRSGHMSTKPEPVLRHFFRMFVDQTTFMLDPTCGSGSALRAAESLDASFVLGVEINEEFVNRARLSLESARRLRKATKGAGYAEREIPAEEI